MRIPMLKLSIFCHGISLVALTIRGADVVPTKMEQFVRRHPHEALCRELCRDITASSEPYLACKGFSRVLPRPRMLHVCKNKFQEGYKFACRVSCLGVNIFPWIDRLVQGECEASSGLLPYPAVFNACKKGFSQGVSAAFRSVKNGQSGEQMMSISGAYETQLNTLGNCSHESNYTKQELGFGRNSRDVAKGTGDENNFVPLGDKADVCPDAIRSEDICADWGNDTKRFLKRLDSELLSYVDYSSLAKDRVKAIHRRRRSNIQRGPACPVCRG